MELSVGGLEREVGLNLGGDVDSVSRRPFLIILRNFVLLPMDVYELWGSTEHLFTFSKFSHEPELTEEILYRGLYIIHAASRSQVIIVVSFSVADFHRPSSR